jgi:glycosyltransferase involved in cell wall biosynthesis
MHLGKRIAVVVPAYNEQRNIGRVIGAMPALVDRIYVVDDCSQDATSEKVRLWQQDPAYADRLRLVQHAVNLGAGAAIVSGYQAAVADGIDVIAVMDGDGQMNPQELVRVITPVCEGRADCVKGNRFASGQAWERMPRHRYYGNRTLAMLTRIASGYWHLGDSQTGFVAVSNKAVQAMPMRELYSRYGYPNHLLIMLAVHDMRVIDVPIEPIYGIGEVSGIRLKKVIPRMSWLLLRKFLWRLDEQRQRQGWNLALGLYALGTVTGLAALPLVAMLVWQMISTGSIAGAQTTFLGITLALSSCSIVQALLYEYRLNRLRHADCFTQPDAPTLLPLPSVTLQLATAAQESKKVAA